MKNQYILTLLAVLFIGVTAQSQAFDDDIESYPLGPIHTAPWSSWDGTAGTGDDLTVSGDQAASGSQSILVPEGGAVDGVLLLGNTSSGTWYLDFKMYIPMGKSGYFNLQNEVPVGTKWNFHVSFNENGNTEGDFTLYDATAGNQGPGNALGTGTYSPDTWFDISFVFDVDAGTMDMMVDGVSVASGAPIGGAQLGAINFFSNEGGGESNRYYVDDTRFDNTPVLGTNDFEAENFSIYPNPVKDVLNIEAQGVVSQVIIYDVLGKVVLSEAPGVSSARINTSSLSSGAYLVTITSEDATRTFKVIK